MQGHAEYVLALQMGVFDLGHLVRRVEPLIFMRVLVLP
jgi:hypothetical protein